MSKQTPAIALQLPDGVCALWVAGKGVVYVKAPEERPHGWQTSAFDNRPHLSERGVGRAATLHGSHEREEHK